MMFSASNVTGGIGRTYNITKKMAVFFATYFFSRYSPLKTNMSPENQWLEDVVPTELVPFQGTC